MSRRCDLCGEDMVLRSQDSRQDTDGSTSSSSSETWWDCACGRSVANFSASTSARVAFSVDDDRG